MKVLVILLGIAGALWAVVAFSSATSAVQEIEAGIGLLIATTGFGLAGVMGQLEPKKPPKPPPVPKEK